MVAGGGGTAKRRLQVEITGDETDAKRSFRQVENDADSLGGRVSGALGKVGPAVAAGLVVGADLVRDGLAKMGEAVMDVINREASNDLLAAQLGLTVQQAESFGRAAGELYAGAWGDSLEDVNEALRFVRQNLGDSIGDSDEALKSVTSRVIDLSKAFGEDYAQMTRAAGTMIKSGLVKDASEALDILTVGFQNGTNAADDLLDTWSEYSTMFRELGIDAKMAAGLMSQGLKAGARDADTVADAIKEFAIRSKDASTTSAEGFRLMGLDAAKMTAVFAKGGPEAERAMKLVIDRLKGMKNPVDQNAAAVALFGTKAEDLGDALFALDPTTAVASLGEVAGASQRMSDTLNDNASTKLESWKRTMHQHVVDFLTGTVIPKIVELGEKAGPALEVLGDKASKAFEWASGKPEVLAAVAAVVGTGLVIAFGALAVAAWSAAAGVIAATWPLLAVVAAVGLLAAGVTWLWNNWDTFREVVQGAVGWLQENVPPIFEHIKAVFVEFYNTAIAPMIRYIDENREAFANLGKVILAVVGGALAVVVVLVAAVILGGLILTAIFVAIVVAVVALVAVLYNVVQVIWDVFNNVRDALGGVVDWFENVIQVVWDVAKNIGSGIADAGRAVWSFVGNVAGMVGAVGSWLWNVIVWFYNLPGQIWDALKGLGSMLFDMGKNMVIGLWNGLVDRWNWLKDKVGGLLGSIRNLFPFSPAKEGPFSGRGWVTYSGEAIVTGLAEGMVSHVGAVESAASTVANAAHGPLQGAPIGATGAGAPAGPSIVVNVNGYVGNEDQLGRAIARHLAAAERRGAPMPWATALG